MQLGGFGRGEKRDSFKLWKFLIKAWH